MPPVDAPIRPATGRGHVMLRILPGQASANVSEAQSFSNGAKAARKNRSHTAMRLRHTHAYKET
ncbi:hypothetical protein AT984_06340 [Paucibacter sp. KCTC 42545]|nr:hypothetical protein AT984_06340 [Paucibacter sp. KCTC 42545]